MKYKIKCIGQGGIRPVPGLIGLTGVKGVFWSKIKGAKNWGETDDFLCVKCFLLSFAQFASALSTT